MLVVVVVVVVVVVFSQSGSTSIISCRILGFTLATPYHRD